MVCAGQYQRNPLYARTRVALDPKMLASRVTLAKDKAKGPGGCPGAFHPSHQACARLWLLAGLGVDDVVLVCNNGIGSVATDDKVLDSVVVRVERVITITAAENV